MAKLGSGNSKPPWRWIFNIAASAPESVNVVADLIGETLGLPVEKTFEPPRAGDIRDSFADVSLAREVLGYAPTVDLAEGIRRTVEAFPGLRG